MTFDPGRLGFRSLLEYFFQVHRPDLDERIVGAGYRSAIVYTSEAQRSVAEDTIRDVDAARHWPGTVVTEITPAGHFWEAGPEDQDYFESQPSGAAPFPATEPATLG